MKVYIWCRINKCSYHYHSEGGVVVFAENEDRAREIANKEEGCRIDISEKPDDVRMVHGGEEKVYIMPDAGCC